MGKNKKAIHILVIEDNKDLNKLLCTHIEKLNCKAVAAYSGTGARELILKNKWDLMLLDYNLPDMNAEILIKEVAKQTTPPPFIIVTGSGNERAAVKMMKQGAYDYWVKEGAFLESLSDRIEQTIREVEDRQKLIKATRAEKNEAITRSLIASAQDGIVGVNKNGDVILHNKAALNLLEIKAVAFQGKSFFSVLSQDKYYLRLHRLFNELVTTNKRQITETSYRINVETKDGEDKFLDVNISVNPVSGEKLYLFVIREINVWQ